MQRYYLFYLFIFTYLFTKFAQRQVWHLGQQKNITR